MPETPTGSKRPADVIGNAVHVTRIATKQTEEKPKVQTKGGKKGGKSLGVIPLRQEDGNLGIAGFSRECSFQFPILRHTSFQICPAASRSVFQLIELLQFILLEG